MQILTTLLLNADSFIKGISEAIQQVETFGEMSSNKK